MHPKMQTAPTGSLGAILSADGAFRELGHQLDDAWRAEATATGSAAKDHRAAAETIVGPDPRGAGALGGRRQGQGRAILWAQAHGRAAMVDALPDTPDLRAV